MRPAAPKTEPMIEVRDLTKRFGTVEAVAGISFKIEPGEVFGFLGPNGAGKTTTIRMLVGLARPDRGRVRIAGFDVQRDFSKAMSHVGCIVESTDLYPFLTGRENLLHFARMLENGAESRIAELARLVFLDGRLDDRVATYSLGMRQRLGLAQALLGAPDLLILDEPANGLDPAGIREIRQYSPPRGRARLGRFVRVICSRRSSRCANASDIHAGARSQGPVRELLERAGRKAALRVRSGERAAEVSRPSARRRGPDRGEESVSSDWARAGAGGAGGARRRGRPRLRRRTPGVDAGGDLSRGYGWGDRMKFVPLVENETLKLLKRRRFRVALLILIALNGLIVFAQTQSRDRRPGGTGESRPGTASRMQTGKRSGRLPQTHSGGCGSRSARAVPPAATWSGCISGPISRGCSRTPRATCCLPLLAILFAAESFLRVRAGTIKLLLTRRRTRPRSLVDSSASSRDHTLTGAARGASRTLRRARFRLRGWARRSLPFSAVGTSTRGRPKPSAWIRVSSRSGRLVAALAWRNAFLTRWCGGHGRRDGARCRRLTPAPSAAVARRGEAQRYLFSRTFRFRTTIPARRRRQRMTLRRRRRAHECSGGPPLWRTRGFLERRAR